MLKAVKHGCGVLNAIAEKQLRMNLFEKTTREKKYCAETLAGAVFQRDVKNKF
jgi:hypothetical protein